MRNFFLSIVINWISLLILSQFLRDWINIPDWKVALFAGFVLALLNALLRPILMILAVPLNVITLGFFTFIVNAIILYLAHNFVNKYFFNGFSLRSSIWIILILSIFMSLLNGFLSSILKRKD
jgi:putative membrane protein